MTIKWTGHGAGSDLSNHVPKNRLAHSSSQITRTWSLESCEKVTRKCRESAWNSRRSKLRSPDIAHIFAGCHLILSPLGSLLYDSPNNICIKNYLSLSPLGTLSDDSPNNMCVKNHLSLSPLGSLTLTLLTIYTFFSQHPF